MLFSFSVSCFYSGGDGFLVATKTYFYTLFLVLLTQCNKNPIDIIKVCVSTSVFLLAWCKTIAWGALRLLGNFSLNPENNMQIVSGDPANTVDQFFFDHQPIWCKFTFIPTVETTCTFNLIAGFSTFLLALASLAFARNTHYFFKLTLSGTQFLLRILIDQKAAMLNGI